MRTSVLFSLVAALLARGQGVSSGELDQAPNTWVKRSPLPGGPPSPRLGYEGACVYDTVHRLLLRYGGHNQGGGGEQGSEMWAFDPRAARWQLMLPNTSPPGVCCAQQAVFDPVFARFIRFPAFSGNHGWQWFREIYLNDSTIWTYSYAENRWRNLRPVPCPRVSPLRCASWDAEFQVVVLFGGEGNREGTVVYDPYTNQWYWMKPAVQPPFRSAGNMAYDVRHRVHVLFGAQFSDDPYTWVYSLRDNRWGRRRPDPSPPSDRNDAVLCYDSVSGKIIALIKITTGSGDQARHRLETWAYDVGQNRWQRMHPEREPDPSGNRARQLMFAPDLNVVLLENRVGRREGLAPEQQIWTYRYGQRPSERSPVAPPRNLAVQTTGDSVILTWHPSADRRTVRYRVEHACADRPWKAEFATVAELDRAQRSFEHRPTGKGVPLYRVRSVAADGSVGPPTPFVRAQPRIVEDIVVSVRSPSEVELQWQAPPGSDDVVGYYIERAPVSVWSNAQLVRIAEQTKPLAEPSVGRVRAIGTFHRIVDQPIRATRYVDRRVDLTQPASVGDATTFSVTLHRSHLREGKPYRYAVYAYRVRAVNRLGTLSGPSPWVLTIPSAPQYVFSRERGTACDLKWQANPESSVIGYRVYRMDGRYRGSQVRRLTPDPISELRFTDPDAGKRTRRYYVVAVDRLGQEGMPSAPVWYRREWQRFYEPFAGEWHQ